MDLLYTSRTPAATSFKNKVISKKLQGRTLSMKSLKLRKSLPSREMRLVKNCTESNWMKVRILLRQSKLKRDLCSYPGSDASTEDEYSHATNIENEHGTLQRVAEESPNHQSAPSNKNSEQVNFVPIDYLPDFSRLVTAQKIYDGTQQVSIRQHIKDIL
jgi:hypothetical protein